MKNVHRATVGLVSLCFWFSGLAALIYQTAWLRRFSTIFGTSELAVVVVLSSYMAGLALGAVLASRLMRLISRPVLFYALLEGLIAAVALLFPVLLSAIESLFIVWFGDQPQLSGDIGIGQSIFYFFGAFLVILLPTTAMGATLPVLSKSVVSEERHIASRIGMLYAINTFGAVVGTLITAFILLPALGLRGTVYCAIAVNFMVFLLALWLASLTTEKQTAQIASLSRAPRRLYGQGAVFPVAMLLSGAVSFTYEVLWTRLLSHVLGSSVAAFATMLASFLTGIAVGSALASAVCRSRQQAVVGFWICQICIAGSAMVVYYSFESVAKYSALLTDWQVLTTILIMLPATLFIGATFPFAVRAYSPSVNSAPTDAGMIYGWNTIGAIVGALCAGFFLIPWLKYEGAIRFAVLFSLLIALLVSGSPMLAGRSRALLAAFSLALVIGVGWFYQPTIPINILRNSSIGAPQKGDVVFYRVGRSATVLVQESDGLYYLRTNGLPEANVSARGRATHSHPKSPLTSIPTLARPEAEKMLVVGLGAGYLIESVADSVQQIDVIELEPEVLAANRFLTPLRHTDPLSDPRVQVHINDARSALQLTSERWDIIVSQPSHPWTAGASHLYTEEFMRIVAERLTPNGVFLQWMNAAFISHDLLASFLRSLTNVYAHVRVYQTRPGVFYFLAAQTPLTIESDYLNAGRTDLRNFVDYRINKLNSYPTLLSSVLMDNSTARSFAADAPPITDEHNLMATNSLHITRSGLSLNSTDRLAELVTSSMPALNQEDWLARHLKTTEQWLQVYDNLFFGREKFLPLLVQQQSTAADYLDLRAKIDFDLDQPLPVPPPTALEFHWTKFLFLVRRTKENPANDPSNYDGFSELPPIAQAGLLAYRALTSDDFRLLAVLDPILSRARPYRPWYELSVKARVAWRADRIKQLEENDPSLLPLAEQMRDIIDEGLQYQIYQNWLHDYASALIVLNDYPALISTGIVLTRQLYADVNRHLLRVFNGPSTPQWRQALGDLTIRMKAIRRLSETLKGADKSTIDPYQLDRFRRLVELGSAQLNKLVIKKGYEKTLFDQPPATPDLSQGESIVRNPTSGQ